MAPVSRELREARAELADANNRIGLLIGIIDFASEVSA
jgi:hypothetical protein